MIILAERKIEGQFFLKQPLRSGDEFLSFLELNRDRLGNTRIFHRHSIKQIPNFHGFLVMGDDNELRIIGQTLDKPVEADHICIVKGSIDLVQQAEGARLDEEDGKDQGNCRQRFLTT